MLAGFQNASARLPRVALNIGSSKTVLLLCMAAITVKAASDFWVVPAGMEPLLNDCEPLCSEAYLPLIQRIWNGGEEKTQHRLSHLGDFKEEFPHLDPKNLLEMASNILNYCGKSACDAVNTCQGTFQDCIGAADEAAKEAVKLFGMIKIFRPNF